MLSDLFKGKRIRLTAPRDSDVAVMAAWSEDSEFMRLFDTVTAYPGTSLALYPDSPGTSYEFRIRLLDTDELIGSISIHSIEWNNQTGTISIGIGSPAHRSKGYGGEAIALMLQYGFWELNLHRIGLYVISYNAAAIRAYERAGFEVEGRLRECVYRDGKRYDRIYMGLLRHEWEARLPDGEAAQG